MARNPHVGSSFESFLEEEGRLEESTALAVKRVLAWQFKQAMDRLDVNNTEMARRMKTSRAVVVRLLNATDTSVTLATISRAANALGVVPSVTLGNPKLKANARNRTAEPEPARYVPVSALAPKRRPTRR